nr:DUF3095 domain-containing protein [uncultured Gellertiella sp.]
MALSAENSFFNQLPVFADFDGVTRGENYWPLPPDWWLATADIVDSTRAIEAGHYKKVNMAGASVISAVMNALGQHDLPFIFGGDGAVIALPGEGAEAARAALPASRAWVRDTMGLTLRVALVPLAAIRAAGLDVRVARFRASEQVSYAMFSGGGAFWAERQMKDGRYGIDESLSTGAPDLTGLSCRWNPVKARHGAIVSIIALPRPGADPAGFARLVSDVVALSGGEDRASHPLPEQGPPVRLSLSGCLAEVRAAAPGLPRLKTAVSVAVQTALIAFLSAFNLKAGSFDAKIYREDVSANSDFRKYDDGLKMTIDIDTIRLEAIRARLQEAEADGICQFGLHVQDTALVTCLVPTPLSRDHMHFIDGGSGGYAMAATRIKQGLAG